MTSENQTAERPLSELIRELAEEGADAPGLACGELCMEAAKRLRELRRLLIHYGDQCGCDAAEMRRVCNL